MYLCRHIICWIKCIKGSYSTPTNADSTVIGDICCSGTGEMLAGLDSAQAQSKSTEYISGSKLENTFQKKKIISSVRYLT